MLILPNTLKRNEFAKRIGHRAVGVVFNPKNDYRQYVPSIMRHRCVACSSMRFMSCFDPTSQFVSIF